MSLCLCPSLPCMKCYICLFKWHRLHSDTLLGSHVYFNTKKHNITTQTPKCTDMAHTWHEPYSLFFSSCLVCFSWHIPAHTERGWASLFVLKLRSAWFKVSLTQQQLSISIKINTENWCTEFSGKVTIWQCVCRCARTCAWVRRHGIEPKRQEWRE